MFRLIFVSIVIAAILVACNGSSVFLGANAGDDFTVNLGEQPHFDGCASTGNIENYKWTILNAPDKMSEDAGKVIREDEPNCSFTLDAQMGVDELGVWEIQLEVRDAARNIAIDTVLVTVTE